MARAIERELIQIHPEDDNTFTFEFENALVGLEIPTGIATVITRVNLTGSDNLSTFEAKRASEIRAAATNLGYTVNANMVLLVTYKTA